MNHLLGVWKLLGLVAHCLAGIFAICAVFPRLTSAQRGQKVVIWANGVLRRLRVELIVVGRTHCAGPLMLAANHSSWLDITALHASLFSRFVAKHELRKWPVIGFMASQSGTLFLERRSPKDALRVVHQIAQFLQNGDVIAIFPEGTTSEGAALLPFHGNLLQAAISVDAPVQPVCIQYLDTRLGRLSNAPHFVGDVHFLTSLWSTLCAQNLSVRVQFGQPQWASGRSRRAWAHDLRSAVCDMKVRSEITP